MTRAAEIPAENGTETEAGRRAFWPLTLGCMGVVYGEYLTRMEKTGWNAPRTRVRISEPRLAALLLRHGLMK